jgi:hypothetical protein
MTSFELVKHRCKGFLDRILKTSTPLKIDKIEISSNLFAHIHQKFQNPSYLDGLEVRSNGSTMSNDRALADFLAVLSIHRAPHIFLSEKTSVRMNDLSTQETGEILRHLQTLLIQLKKISHGSGRVAGRKNGALAFSHWLEAGYLYLLYDPRPSIEGLYQVLCHDIYEDPKWHVKPTERQDSRVWALDTVGSDTQTALKKRVERLIGKSGGATIERHFTKPPVIFTNSEMQDGLALTTHVYSDILAKFGLAAANAYLKEKAPNTYERGQIRRNEDFIQNIIALNDRDFLKKMPDLLSNLRTLDAFVITETTEIEKAKWKAKILRKLEEVCKYYLPRLIQTGNAGYAYLILIHHEVTSIDAKFNLGLASKHLSHFWEKLTIERNALSREWIRFHKIESRPLPNNRATERSSLELTI